MPQGEVVHPATSLRDAIARNLNTLRSDRRLRQRDLSDLMFRYAGIEWTQQIVANIERGKRTPSLEELLALALILRVPVLELIQEDGVGLDLGSGIWLTDGQLKDALGIEKSDAEKVPEEFDPPDGAFDSRRLREDLVALDPDLVFIVNRLRATREDPDLTLESVRDAFDLWSKAELDRSHSSVTSYVSEYERDVLTPPLLGKPLGKVVNSIRTGRARLLEALADKVDEYILPADVHGQPPAKRRTGKQGRGKK